VQTGSSSKLFTLVTALEQGIPFGFTQTVPGSETISGYRNCQDQPVGSFKVTNAEGPGTSTDTLYTGTTNSINVFFAELEKKVGLCNVVRTASKLGVTNATGQSLLAAGADNYPAFTLGVVGVSPMSMAAAYATAASGGTYCAPIALDKVIDSGGRSLPVPSAGCHQAMPGDVASAVNHILQGVLTTGTGSPSSGGPGGIHGYQAAGKTGTSNVENGHGTPYAAFAGYTTNLVAYTSVFNPISPTSRTMANTSACYRTESGGATCPGEMFGANAPATTWHMAFDHADLHGSSAFAAVPTGSKLWSQGTGGSSQAQKNPGKGGNPSPTPSATPSGSTPPGKSGGNPLPTTFPTFPTVGPGGGNSSGPPQPTTGPGGGGPGGGPPT
jgi:membrane peptidoglycan carboxypeptidase